MQRWAQKRIEMVWIYRNRRCYEQVTRIHRKTLKKDLIDANNHNGVNTQLEPDILESEVK